MASDPAETEATQASTNPLGSAPAALRVQVGSSAPPAPLATGGLAWRLAGVLKTMRPHQWVKNVFVLAPVVFAKEIFETALLTRAASAFAVFCLLAGAVYAMNDLADVEADRQHPLKRFRPIASGQVPVPWARFLCVALVLGAFAWALSINVAFFVVAFLYFAQNIAYSLRLKHTPYVDVGCISAGFVMRVMAGGYATGIVVSKYLLVCTALLALFLGFGKRRHELAAAATKAKVQRQSLGLYTRRGLDIALAGTGTATIATYLIYTLDANTRAFFRSDNLWLSTILVALALLRFLAIVRGRPHAESPTQEMLRDGPMVAIGFLWVVLVMWMVYQLRPGG